MSLDDRIRICCDAKRRARRAAQIIIDEIGAAGPENVEVTAQRAVDEIRRGREAVALLKEIAEAAGMGAYVVGVEAAKRHLAEMGDAQRITSRPSQA